MLLGLFRCLHPAVLLGVPALLPGLLPGLPPLYQPQAHCARAPALQWLQQRARWQGELAGQHVGGRPGRGYQGAPQLSGDCERNGLMSDQPGPWAWLLCSQADLSLYLSEPQVLRGDVCFFFFFNSTNNCLAALSWVLGIKKGESDRVATRKSQSSEGSQTSSHHGDACVFRFTCLRTIRLFSKCVFGALDVPCLVLIAAGDTDDTDKSHISPRALPLGETGTVGPGGDKAAEAPTPRHAPPHACSAGRGLEYFIPFTLISAAPSGMFLKGIPQ